MGKKKRNLVPIQAKFQPIVQFLHFKAICSQIMSLLPGHPVPAQLKLVSKNSCRKQFPVVGMF